MNSEVTVAGDSTVTVEMPSPLFSEAIILGSFHYCFRFVRLLGTIVPEH